MRCLQPVAITGAGLVCAAGETLPETLRAFAEVGRTMAGPPPFPTNFSFPVFRSPLGTQEIAPLPAIYSRTVALAYRAALEALACAGIARESVPEMRFGLVVGTSVGASLDFFDFYQELSAGEAPDLAPIDRYVASNPGPALG
ncbi:MAG: hypothetical protein LBP61_04815, partial [Desulfovibrio sp.]|nr:hypothetical protein [Desulfovibrio sp.]